MVNLSEGIGFLNGAVSNAFTSYLGNTLSQNNFGSQVTNTFGTMNTVFMDGIRLWEKTSCIDDPKLGKLLAFETTPASMWMERLQKFAGLGGLGPDLGLITREKDSKGQSQWGGSTTLNVGDVATLNYKGDNVNVFRAVNQLTFCPGSTTDNAESFLPYEAQVQTFFKVMWTVGLLSSLAFQQYSVTVAVDQDVADNRNWQIANMAMEIAQYLVLYLANNYESSTLTSIATQEREAAAIASNDAQSLSISSQLGDMEQRLQQQISDLSSQVANLQVISPQSFKELQSEVSGLANKVAQTALEQKQMFAITTQNQMVLMQALLDGLGYALEDVGLFAEMEETVEMAKAEAADAQAQLEATNAKAEALESASLPVSNSTVPADNAALTSANLDGASSLDPTAVESSAVVDLVSEVATANATISGAQVVTLAAQSLSMTAKGAKAINTGLVNLTTTVRQHEDALGRLMSEERVLVRVPAAEQKTAWKKFKRFFLTGSSTKYVIGEMVVPGGKKVT